MNQSELLLSYFLNPDLKTTPNNIIKINSYIFKKKHILTQ